MSDVPSWNPVARPLLEATKLLCSHGERPDDSALGGCSNHSMEPKMP